MLRFSPVKDEATRQIQSLLKSSKEGALVVKNIEQYFGMEDDKGPVLIEQENGPDDFIKNVRKDAYTRIKKLLSPAE